MSTTASGGPAARIRSSASPMALPHPAALRHTPTRPTIRRCGALEALSGGMTCLRGAGRLPSGPVALRVIAGRAKVRLAEAPPPPPAGTVEKEQIRAEAEIPVTCYQILGVSVKAEKDEIVKAAMELKKSEIEDGYTEDVIVSRQDLLMDVRDKLLFEPQYAGDVREKVPPKSSIRIPWSWLPAALCLLQEVGEDKLVLEIGRIALQLSDVKPYDHDVLLSMALAECSIAKTGFEKNKVSEGFEALARAQYLLRSKTSLGEMPLLAQIEESLEELAPACVLDLLGQPHTPHNAERRRGAVAALRELLRQGLDIEASCRVHDWPCFLSLAMNKLWAAEVVDLLSWDKLAIARKNKKSLESQNQRIVVDFSCFYMAMIAHIALGFSTRRIDLISQAKTICECLIASESMDLKIEEAFCLLLLGQGDKTDAIEKLREIEINRSSALRGSESTLPNVQDKNKSTTTCSLETWIKDAVLSVFVDTRDCSPSLACFFRGLKQSGVKQKFGTVKIPPSISSRSPYLGLSPEASAEQLRMHSNRYLGEAVKQLAPSNLQRQFTSGKTIDSTSAQSVQMKKDLGLRHRTFWERIATGDIVRSTLHAMVVGCVMFGALKFMHMRHKYTGISHKYDSGHPSLHTGSLAWTMNNSPDLQRSSAFTELLELFRQKFKHQPNVVAPQSTRPSEDLSATTGTIGHKRQMPVEEAESLVKQWQDIKAEALGPNHQTDPLSEILAEPMLSKWKGLANSAKANSCFWKFVLLQMSVLRADILSDEVGNEVTEIEAVLEEAAELVEESQPRKTNYYSTYKVKYILKREDDGSWRFCGGGIERPV